MQKTLWKICIQVINFLGLDIRLVNPSLKPIHLFFGAGQKEMADSVLSNSVA